MGTFFNKNKFGKTALTILLSSLVLVGCGGSGESKSEESKDSGDVVTLTFFNDSSTSKLFNDAVAQKITEKTGVKIEFESPTGDPNEKLNLMLSGGNYPDLVQLGRGEMLDRYIEAGALVSLDDLIEESGPDIKEMYGDILNKSRYSDGHIYSLNNWYGKDPDASSGVLMRRDLLAEIVGDERANSAEPFTQSEYINILKKFKEKYPQIDGTDSVALSLNGDSTSYEGALYGMFGMKTYYQAGNGLEHRSKDPQYLKAVSFLNDLSITKLLDPEWQVTKSEQWTQKLSSGVVFSTFGYYWETDAVNAALRASKGEDSQFYSYKIVADDLDPSETTYNGRNSLGWTGIAITKNCENVDAAIKLMNFLASEEGQYLMLWGVEGEHWSYVDGKRTPNADILQAFKTDAETISSETGIRKWAWLIKNGKGTDGSPYDMSTKYDLDSVSKFANESFGDSDYWDSAEFSGIEPIGNSSTSLKWQKVQDVYDQAFGSLVSATSKSEMESAYSTMLKNMEDAGLAEAEEFITEAYNAKMKLWDSAK